MNTIDKILPVLRGCTFDGVKGSIIRTESGSPEAEHIIADYRGEKNEKGGPVLFLPEDTETDKTVSAFKDFTRRNGNNPVYAVIGDRAVCAFGDSYDEAQSRLEAFSTGKGGTADSTDGAEQQAPYTRNDVVRNKVAVVTGAAQGFGEGLARELAAAGSLVCIADLNFEGAETLALELNRGYGRTAAIPVKVNVTDEASVEEMFRYIVLQTGGIDLVISNAGVLKAGSVKEIELKDFRFVTEVNYTGYFIMTKFAAPILAAQNKASRAYFTDIIQINSKSGLEGSNKNGAYAGGKFGGIGLTQSFAKELVEDNIKVNSICPGNFFEGPLWSDPDRGLFVQYLKAGKVPGARSIGDVKKFYESKVPMGRGCTGQDVIRAVYYIIEQKYETGQAVPVTGGQIMLN